MFELARFFPGMSQTRLNPGCNPNVFCSLKSFFRQLKQLLAGAVWILLSVMIFALSSVPFASGKIVSDAIYKSVRLGPHFIRRELPGKTSETLTAYSLTYFHPLVQRLRLELDIFHAPDVDQRSKQLKVQQDWSAFAVGLDLSYPKLFRWNAGLAFMALKEATTIQFSSDRLRQSSRAGRIQYLPRLRLGIDYAITEQFEIATYLLYWHRLSNARTDWSWGVGLTYNLGNPEPGRASSRSGPIEL